MVNYRTNREWDKFKIDYLELLENRKIKEKYRNYDFKNTCFLCSEDEADGCHRKILSEYLDNSAEIVHL